MTWLNGQGTCLGWLGILVGGCGSVQPISSPISSLPDGQVADLVVQGNVRYQTIDAWAVFPRLWEEDKVADRFDGSFEPYLEESVKFLVEQVGINGVRIAILSGMENPIDRWSSFYRGEISYDAYQRTRYEKINDDDNPNSATPGRFQFAGFDYRMERMVLPLKRALEARGEKLHINLCYQDFRWNSGTVQGTLSHANRPDEFAEFVSVYFNHLRDHYDLIPDSFEIILEPENTAAWRGAQIGRAVLAVTDRLGQEGFSPEIIAPSNTSMPNAIRYFDDMVAIAGAANRVGVFSYHRYGAEREADVQSIAARAKAQGMKTAMLEKVGAGIDQLFEDLEVGQISAWQQWGFADLVKNSDAGGYYLRVDPTQPPDQRIAMAKRTLMLAPVFLRVRSGAVRVQCAGQESTTPCRAFINRDGSWVVAIRFRSGGSSLSLGGLPAGRYRIQFADDDPGSGRLETATLGSNGVLGVTAPGAGLVVVSGLVGGS